VGKDEKGWISQNPSDYKNLAVAAVILFLLYLIAKKLGLANISTGSKGSPSSLLVVLVVGLTAGISTCMALVGGLILGISARHSEKHPEATPAQKFRPHLFFNLGRIVSYALLGGIIGLIGKAFQFSGLTLGLLTVIVGIVMLTLGIQLTEIFPKISSAHFTLPAGLAKLLGIKKSQDKEYSHFDSIATGALTFFLPCGFTQAMQLYAMTTGSFWHGAAIMGIFALGTAPGLLSIGGLTSFIKGAFAKNFFRFAGLLVVTLALLNISNGFHLLGWKGISISRETNISPTAKIENGYQIVNMTQSAGGYSPNKFTIQKGIPVKWIINSTNANSCSSGIVSSQLNIRKFLSQGENTIEFTPTVPGDISFSCTMGMYTGKFTVTN
jgi:sulfite exporter TauE/SafE